MKSVALLCLALVGVSADYFHFDKQEDEKFMEKQSKVLNILSGVSVHDLDSKYYRKVEPFTFDKPSFYTDHKVVEDFMRRFKRGFLPRDAVFTLNDYKARHDTFKLFELFFFAKDFDTFIQIAEWAKNEVNPTQFTYAFIIAVYQRKDCKGIYLPPSYELFPHYYVPSHIMRQADIASMKGVKERTFKVNNTGQELSWYRDVISDSSRSTARWAGKEVESRVAYFREDPGLSHWYSAFMLRFATWLSPIKYPGIDFIRRGEVFYSTFKWILGKYNMERLSADLPPVTPFQWNKPLVGYNPGLVDSLGFRVVNRPDNLVPMDANPKAFKYVEYIEDRVFEALHSQCYYDFRNNSMIYWSEKDAVDIIGKIVFGERDGIGRYYYKPWFFHLSEAMTDMVHASNERDYTINVMSRYMTQPRDPVFWQLLSSMDRIFAGYTNGLTPYTKEKLLTDGVRVKDIEFDNLMTYFERWEYEITEGVLVGKPEERETKSYLVSQPRLNHKPFKFTLIIESDRAMRANIRVLLGPNNQLHSPDQMSLNQARHLFYPIIVFVEKLKPGENVIHKGSGDFFYYEHFEPIKEFKHRLAQANTSSKPLRINTMLNCGFPANLLLPRGRTGGKDYSIFVMVNEDPEINARMSTSKHYQCGNEALTDKPIINFPFDRPIPFKGEFLQPNMLFKPVKIYHKAETDINRSFTAE